MKRLRLSLLALMLLVGSSAMWAHDFEVDGIYYNITSSEDKTVEVTYKGESYYEFIEEYTGSVTIPETVTYDEVIYRVTSIGSSAFSNCSNLTDITIPNSVTSIINNPFHDCSGLTSIVVEEGNEYYDSRNNCNAIIETETNTLKTGCKNTIIPNSVTSIGAYAFYGCTGLTAITIPNSVTSIANNAFNYCSGLASIVVEEGYGYYDSRNNCNAIIETETNTLIRGCKNTIIPNSVTSIGWDAFHSCPGLASIVIPESVTSIGDDAFWNCNNLKTVVNYSDLTITKGSTSNGQVAYNACRVLSGEIVDGFCFEEENGEYVLGGYVGKETTLILPETYKGKGYSIGKNAFRDCSELISITIPNGVTKNINSWTFYGCYHLTSISLECDTIKNWFSGLSSIKEVRLGDKVTNIGDNAFNGCSGLTDITIPNSVTSIGEEAFRDCSGLTNITIPNSVTSIGSGAFYKCSNLTSLFIECDTIKSYWFRGLESIQEVRLGDKVTCIEDGAFCFCSGLTDITIPNSVTSIEDGAFERCSGLTSITFPNSVTRIGDGTFRYCYNLTDITIPNSVTSIEDGAFEGCSGLTAVTIPNSVTSIGRDAFEDCFRLTSITIPNSVTSIGDGAFRNCSGLTDITILEGVKGISTYAFDGCSKVTSLSLECDTIKSWFSELKSIQEVRLGDKVTIIGDYAFWDCTGLTSITIPNSVTSIGMWAFKGCYNLTSIIIPENVTSIKTEAFYKCSCLRTVVNHSDLTITKGSTNNGYVAYYADRVLSGEFVDGFCFEEENGDYVLRGYVGKETTLILPETYKGQGYRIGEEAFKGCYNLTSVTIPNGVMSIEYEAFYDCYNLTSITIPKSVEYISEDAFSYCSSLASIVVEEGNEYYDSRNNCNAIIDTESNTLITGCKNTIIPNGVTSIGFCAFLGCTDLTAITIPNGVTSIEVGAFGNCYSLTSITIPNSVTSIRGEAFGNCYSLTSITIPSSVTSIGNSFYGCNSLQSVKMLSSTPPAAAEDIFIDCPDTLVIYVPYGASANYDVAPWNNYEIIEKGEDYAIWASDMRTRPTKPITISVQLNNVNAISDYQFDLTLPKGFSIAMDEDDLEMIYLSTERTTERKHTYSYNMLSDSLLRVICYSNSTYTFSGTEGEVLTITLDVAADVADGDYNLMIKNIEMTEPDGTAHKASDYPCKVTIVSYTPGDTNNDGNFSVTDVRGIVNMVLAAQVPDDNLAGDVNEDGVISVTDVRGVVNLVLNPVTPTKQLSSKMRSATSSANLLYIEPFSIAPGEEKEVLVMLNNPDDAFSDIQFDLYLPEGMEVVNDNEGYLIDLGSRTDLRNHNRPEAALQRDGSVRVLCYSDKAETFFGHSGDVIRLTLKASENLPAGLYNLQLKNVELARPDMTNDRPQASTTSVSVDGNATGIGSLATESAQGEIYDMNGRRVMQPAKGVYIINGKKVMIK